MFAKIFHSFDKNIIMQWQFRFFAELQNGEYSQNTFFYYTSWAKGMSDFHELSVKYSNTTMTTFDMNTYLIMSCGQYSHIRLAYYNNNVPVLFAIFYYLYWLQFARLYL